MKTIKQSRGGARGFTTCAFLLLALALWLPGEARAQWTTPDANGHIRNNNDGNVGVGTGATPPQVPLTVKSDTNVMPLLVHGANSNVVSFGVRNDQPTSKGWAFQVAGTNNLGGAPVGSFIIRQATNDFNTFVVSPMGNIGVGAMTPTNQLHVHNPSGFGAMRVSGNGAAILNFQDANAAANARLYQLRNEGGLFRLSLVNDAENGFVRQNLLVATADGNVGIGVASPGRALSITGANAPAMGISMSGTERATFGVATIAGQWFSGAAANDSALRSEATDLWLGTSSGSRAIRFATNDAQRMIIDGAGNVGVGTSAPAFRLDVSGQVRSSGGFVFPDGSVQATAATGTVTGVTAGSGLTGGGTSGAVTLTNSDPGSAQNIFKNVANAAGAVQFSAGANNDALRFEGSGGTTVSFDPAAKKVVINSSAGGGSAANVSAGQFGASTGGGDYSFPGGLSAAGRVGIGTTSPASNLHLSVPGSTTPVGAVSVDVATFATAQNAAASYFLRVRDIGAGSTPFYVRGDGNVGVGTAAPGNRLHLTTASALDGLRLDGNNTWASLLTNLGDGSYNNITRSGDRGIVYGGASAGNPGGGFVITPWSSATGGVRLDPAGNVGIGTATPTAKLDVAGSIKATGDLTVDGAINAKYQDVAEWVPSTQRLAAGTVVVLDVEKSNHVLASTSSYDTRVAGVVSAQPGVLLGEGGEGKLMVATTGRVMVKVDATRAPVKIGDLLVTSDVEGVAMKSVPVAVGGRQLHAPGTIIGKALEPLEKGTGTILVLLSLQ